MRSSWRLLLLAVFIVMSMCLLQIPGHHAEKHYYWLLPVCVPSPKEVAYYMNKHVRWDVLMMWVSFVDNWQSWCTWKGFDVTSGATQLTYVPRYNWGLHFVHLVPLNCYWLFDLVVALLDVTTILYTPRILWRGQLQHCMDWSCEKHKTDRYCYSLVYLPVTPETPEWAIEKMACCLRDALQSSSRL